MSITASRQSYLAILLMVGGLVIILSLLMGWFNFIGWVRSGFDLMTKMLNEEGYAYAPHVAVVVGPIAMIAGILCLKMRTKAIPVATAVLGIFNIVMSAMFAVCSVDTNRYYQMMNASAEPGVWVSVVGGIIVVVASLLILALSSKADD